MWILNYLPEAASVFQVPQNQKREGNGTHHGGKGRTHHLRQVQRLMNLIPHQSEYFRGEKESGLWFSPGNREEKNSHFFLRALTWSFDNSENSKPGRWWGHLAQVTNCACEVCPEVSEEDFSPWRKECLTQGCWFDDMEEEKEWSFWNVQIWRGGVVWNGRIVFPVPLHLSCSGESISYATKG